MNTTTTDALLDARYRLGKEIGIGTFSTVYDAIDTVTDRLVAVKLFKPSGGIERFLRVQHEVSILTALNHPNIVKTLAVGQDGGTYYLVMELIQGTTLSQLLHRYTRLLPAHAVSVVMAISEALDHVHRHGVIHRDLKPANIMVTFDPNESVKILDFGLAWAISMSDRFAVKEVAGSFLYMAPEQTGILQIPIDCRTDLYALGVIFYEMLAGHPPFQGTGADVLIHQHVAKLPPPLRATDPALSPMVEEIVLKLLRKDPQERYQTAAGLLSDLRECQQALIYGRETSSFALGQADRPTTPVSFHVNLVGRQNELAMLRAAFDHAADGQGGMLLVSGEPGIGKSRFVNEMRGYVTARGGLFISGKCNEHTRIFPYAPFVEAVQEYIRQTENFPHEKRHSVGQNIKKRIGEMGEELTRILPEVKVFFGETSRLATLSWEQDKQVERFLSVASDFMVSLASAEVPVLLFWDDLQWIDSSTLQLLERMLPKAATSHLLIVAAYRDSSVSKGHSLYGFLQIWKHAYREITLRFLSLSDLQSLLTGLLRMDDATASSLAEIIYEKTTGNPFFVLELLKAIFERKMLTVGQQGWTVDLQRVGQAMVSAQVDDVILQRLGPLLDDRLEVLSYAAVVGRHFTFEDLVHIAPQQPDQILRCIDEAMHRHIILPRTNPTGEDGYTFAHDKILEALYSRIDGQTKQKLHQRIAETLEERHHDRLSDVMFKLALHFANGLDRQKALRYSVSAGDLAKQAYANSEAANFYTTVLQLLAERVTIENIDSEKLALKVKENLGDVNFFLGRYEDAHTYYSDALLFLTDKSDISRVETKIGTVFFRQGRPGDTLEHCGKGLAALGIRQPKTTLGIIASVLWESLKQTVHTYFPRLVRTRTGDHRVTETVRLFEPLFYHYYFLDMRRCIQVHMKQLNLAEQLGDIEFLTIAYVNHEKICSAIGMHKRALRYSEKAFAMRTSPEQGPRAAGEALLAMGMAHYYHAEWDTAANYFLKAVDEMMKIGNLWQVEVAYGHLALVYLWKASFDKMLECGIRIREIAEAVKNVHGLGWAEYVFAMGSYHQGKLSQALDHAHKAVSHLEAAGDHLITSVSLELLGRIYLKTGQLDHALAVLTKSRNTIVGNTLFHDLITGTYTVLTEVHVRAADQTETDRALHLRRARKASSIALILSRLFKNWGAAAHRSRGQYEWAAGKRAKAMRSFQKSLKIASCLGARHEEGRTYLEMAKCMMHEHRV